MLLSACLAGGGKGGGDGKAGNSAAGSAADSAAVGGAGSAGSADSSAKAAASGTFTDSRDGKTYRAVKIGKQTWMAQNLDYAAEGSICYEDEPENCKKYGRLYNWKTAMTACPKGWHLPSLFEWNELVDTAGSETAGKKLKSTSGWSDIGGVSGNGTDEYGFKALPNIWSNVAAWWTSTMNGEEENGSGCSYYRIIFGNGDDVEEKNCDFDEYQEENWSSTFAVRCLKD